MGCDIHAYVEYVGFIAHDGEPYWQCLMQNFGDRDYDFFSVLANCGRGEFRPLFPNRGLPEGRLSYTVEQEMWLTISSDKDLVEERGLCSESDAARWAAHGHEMRETIINEERVHRQIMHPDLHSHNWLTCDELTRVIAWWISSSNAGYPYGVEWDAALAAMRSLEERGHKTRLIFAFDN